MVKKDIPVTLYYCAERTLTMAGIPHFAQEVMELMYDDMENAGIEITGPPEFQYYNVDPTGEKPFQLIIALPVAEQKEAGSFFFMQSEPFPCLSIDYKGAMAGIGDAWMELASKAVSESYLLANQGREVYKEWEGTESVNNLTELQIGILAKKQ
ncbi:hypothetical protein [Desulfosediminicola flagellatus]|uniref:hypothetical protein n=1 Tax=Desulfosediminicola flagellatus TaxID=2569541 RepID=UPI0010AD2B19|nr:hypothetical protein [Desulfosediminicola flagellatus]